MATMSGVKFQSSPHKHILQQTNNIMQTNELDAKIKPVVERRDVIILRRKRKASPVKSETENYVDLQLDKPVHILHVADDTISKHLQNKKQSPNIETKDSSSQVEENVLIGQLVVQQTQDDSNKQTKQKPILPNYVTNNDKGIIRKPRQLKELEISSHSSRIVKPQSLSIQRRNARERNRVKQVNDGFTALRNRIPDYISDTYSLTDKSKTKKLSKVETLRMAVDYIKHLQVLLNVSGDEDDGASSISSMASPSFSVSPTNSTEHIICFNNDNLYLSDSSSVIKRNSFDDDDNPINLEVAKDDSQHYNDVFVSDKIVLETYPGNDRFSSNVIEYSVKNLSPHGSYEESELKPSPTGSYIENLSYDNSYVHYIREHDSNSANSPGGIHFVDNCDIITYKDDSCTDSKFLITEKDDSVLPSITETFNKNSLSQTFYGAEGFVTYDLVNLCKKEC